MTFDIYNSC